MLVVVVEVEEVEYTQDEGRCEGNEVEEAMEEDNGRGRERVMAPVVGGRERSKKTPFLGGEGTRWKDRGVYSKSDVIESERSGKCEGEKKRGACRGKMYLGGYQRARHSLFLPS